MNTRCSTGESFGDRPNYLYVFMWMLELISLWEAGMFGRGSYLDRPLYPSIGDGDFARWCVPS